MTTTTATKDRVATPPVGTEVSKWETDPTAVRVAVQQARWLAERAELRHAVEVAQRAVAVAAAAARAMQEARQKTRAAAEQSRALLAELGAKRAPARPEALPPVRAERAPESLETEEAAPAEPAKSA